MILMVNGRQIRVTDGKVSYEDARWLAGEYEELLFNFRLGRQRGRELVEALEKAEEEVERLREELKEAYAYADALARIRYGYSEVSEVLTVQRREVGDE